MSDWIDEEAEKLRRMQADKQFRESAVNLSNFWLSLRQQIDSDIERINNNEIFRSSYNLHIIIREAISSYIIQATMSGGSTSVSVVNNFDEIQLLIETYKKGDTTTTRENLSVVESGRNIVLKRFREEFIVPEQASKHILSPIMKMLQESSN